MAFPVACFAVAAVVATTAAMFVPDAADKVLKSKLDAHKSWHDEMFAKLKGYGDGYKPGADSAVDTWLADERRLSSTAELPSEWERDLAGLDVGVVEHKTSPSLDDMARKWSCHPSTASRAAIGVVTGLAAGACVAVMSMYGVPPVVMCCYMAALAVLSVVAWVDVESHMIPWESCAAVMVLGIVAQLSSGDITQITNALIWSAIVYFALSALGHLSGTFGAQAGIGQGDARMCAAIVMLFGPTAALVGFIPTILGFGIVLIALMVAKRYNSKSQVAMGPVFACWCALSMVIPHLMA